MNKDIKNLDENKYRQMVKEASPKSHLITDCIKAFIVGGAICTIGQWITNMLKLTGLDKEAAGSYTTVILIFLGVLLTGLGVYHKIGKFAGAGSIVPVTGFANSVVAPSIEYKKEGFIFGIGAKMFTIAGPVILYGSLTSILVGAVYYFMK